MARHLIVAGIASASIVAFVLARAPADLPRGQVATGDPAAVSASTEGLDSGRGPASADLQKASEPADPEANGSPEWQAGAALFRKQVGEILASKCLECHEPNRSQGGLDLSRRATALAGGDSGEAIVPGEPAQSFLYQLVTAAEMPPGPDQLPSAEIAALERWIRLGAPYDGTILVPPHAEDQGEVRGDSEVPTEMAMCPCMRMMMDGMSGTGTATAAALPLAEPLTKAEASERAEHYLNSLGNPRLKTGKTDETIISYEVQVVTKEGSLVNWMIVDKQTGRITLLH